MNAQRCVPLVLAALLATSFGAQARERLLGATRLTHHENDVDVISVACKPRVHAIMVRAARGSAEIEHLWVRYGNGDRDTLPVRSRIAEGGQTRWIDLAGGKRCVVAIGVVGDTELSLDQTRLEVFGR